MAKSLIGIIADWQKEGSYNLNYPWYALRENYASAVMLSGGVPILLPYDHNSIDDYISLIDGLLIPGGDYDIDPAEYGEKSISDLPLRDKRYQFEKEFLTKYLGTKKPVLGICAGEQLLAVLTGGKLIQDIKSEIPGAIEHEQRKQGIKQGDPYHDIFITPGSLLYKICGTDKIKVNSSHHQAVKSVGENISISAVAQDGIIEAIEVKDHKFALGLEWHPEFLKCKAEKKIFDYFIKVASE